MYFSSYISGSLAPTPTPTPDAESSRQVGHQTFVSTQTLGSMDTGCEAYPVITQNLGSVVTGREALVPTQTQASLGTITDQARSSTRECPTVVAPTSYGYPSAEATRATAQWLRYDEHAGVSDHPHTASQGQPWPSAAPQAPTMESHYQSTGNDHGGMVCYPPIVQLEPWNDSNVDRGDMEWEQNDEERYDYSQADVGVPTGSTHASR